MSTQLVVEISASSHWRRLYRLIFLVSTLVLISASSLALVWLYIMASIGLIVWVASDKLSGSQYLHLTGCNIEEINGYWQLLKLNKGSKIPILWQAKLVKSQSFPHCVQFIFDTEQPLQRRENILIWKDQVTTETWRQLKVLTRWG